MNLKLSLNNNNNNNQIKSLEINYIYMTVENCALKVYCAKGVLFSMEKTRYQKKTYKKLDYIIMPSLMNLVIRLIYLLNQGEKILSTPSLFRMTLLPMIQENS